MNYLTTHNYPLPMAPKDLTHPSVKNFTNMILFLFQQLDPNFEFQGKFEEEVVTIFKSLGYPSRISKNDIISVGTQHAWPLILAAMLWLIELLTYGEACSEEADSDDHDDLSDKAFYTFLYRSYDLFLSGDDAGFDRIEGEFSHSLDRKNAAVMEQTKTLETRNQDLQGSIAVVEGRRAELPELEEKKEAYISDLGKFEVLIEQLEKHKSQLHQKTQDRETELERLTVAVQNVQAEIDALSKTVETQELSPEDVSKMVAERERLEEQQQHASENRQAVQRKVWECETKLRDDVQTLEDSARAYNSIAEDLKLVPATARNSKGKNLSLVVDINAKSGSGLLKTDVQKDIVPHLASTKQELDSTSSNIRNELLAETEQMEEIEQSKSELSDQRNSAEAKAKRAEDAYKREKGALNEVIALQTKEQEEMEQRLSNMRDSAADDARAKAATRRISEAKASAAAAREEHARQKEEINNSVMEVVAGCASHRELVRGRLDTIKDLYSEALQQQINWEPAVQGAIMPPAPPL